MGKDEMTTVSVPITVEERAERADIMADLVAQITAVKAQAKTKAFEFREAVEALIDRLEEHARVLRAGHEERSQLDLTFPESEAAKALHAIAAAACTCIDPNLHAIDCPVHGVDGELARKAAAEREQKAEDKALSEDLTAAANAVAERATTTVSVESGEPQAPEAA